jgi:predicted Ser/Thr protein kinase
MVTKAIGAAGPGAGAPPIPRARGASATAIVFPEQRRGGAAALQSTVSGGPAATWGPDVADGEGAALGRGDTVDRYVILARLAEGGMGVVFAAYDPELDRKVALKLVRPTRRSEARQDEARARLLREAQALAQLQHPAVVAIHDVGTVGERVWLAMEYVEGVTLARWLERPRTWREVLEVFRRAGEGLAAAHAGGVVHHDFKPDNVLVGGDGAVVKVVDFGLARVALGTAAAVSGELSDAGSTARAGAVQTAPTPNSGRASGATQASEHGPVGTLAYMAPERHALRPADARSDQFSFCVALYEALYSQRPFAGADVAALRQAVLHGEPGEPPRGTPVPARVAAALRRGLARAPEDRFPTMAALLAALAGPRSRLHWGLPAGLVVGVSAALMLAARGTEDRCAGAEALDAGWWQAHADGLPEAVRERHAGLRARALATCAAGMRGELAPDLRLAREACLDGQAAILRALVSAAEAVPEQRAALWAEAPDGAVCDDPAVLVAVAAPAFERRGEVAAVREGLARVGAAEVAGAYAAARAEVGPWIARAEALGYAPLVAEALYQRGRLEHYSGESSRATESLLAAVDLAEANRHDRLAADAWGFVAEVAALGGREESAAWLRRAEAARLRLTAGSRSDAAESGPQQVHAALTRGLAALRADDAGAAAQAFRGALGEAGLHPLTRAKLQLNLAYALGDGAEADAAWAAALAAYEHPRIAGPHRAQARIERGNRLFWFERYAEAREQYAAGATLLAAEAAPTRQQATALRDAYRGIAVAEAIEFRLVAAGAAIEQAEQAAAASELVADTGLAEVAFEVHLLAGRPDEARRIAAEALAAIGTDAPLVDRAMARARLGEALLWLAEDDAAGREFTAALTAVAAAVLPAGDDTAAYAYKGLGLRALRAGSASDAAEALARATALWQASPCDCRDAAEAELGLAAAYAALGDARGPALRTSGERFFAGHGDEAKAHQGRLERLIGGANTRRAL